MYSSPNDQIKENEMGVARSIWHLGGRKEMRSGVRWGSVKKGD
jgi:hypothetical protein